MRKHCSKKLLVKCLHKVHRHHFAEKYPTQCCLDLHGPALHKENTCAMLGHSPQTTLHRQITYNVVWICLGQHCARKLPVQCWFIANRQLLRGK